MTGLFKPKTPKTPEPQAPPAQPDDTATSDAEAERIRRRRGRASTVLAGNSTPGSSQVGIKTLLGQ